MKSERDLEILAAIVHGVMAVLHCIAVAFNLLRRSRIDAAVHGAAAIYDAVGAVRHGRAASRGDS